MSYEPAASSHTHDPFTPTFDINGHDELPHSCLYMTSASHDTPRVCVYVLTRVPGGH